MIKNKHSDEQGRHITEALRKAIKYSIALVVFSVSTLLFIMANKQIVTSLEEQVVSISKSINSTMTSFYKEIEGILKLLETDQTLVRVIESMDSTEKPIRGVFNQNSNPDYLELKRQLEIILENNEEVEEIYLATSKNQYLQFPSVEKGEDFKITSSSLYRQFMDTQGITWSSPYIEESTGKTYINIGFPVKKGIVIKGVLSLKLDYSKIADKAEGSNIGTNGFYSLVSKSKSRDEFKVIHSTEGEVSPLIIHKNIVSEQKEDTDAPVVGLRELIEDANVNINTQSKLKSISIANKKYNVFVHDDHELGLYKVIGVEQKEFRRKSANLLVSSIIVSGTIGSVSIVLLLRLLNKLSLMTLTDPLTKLKNRRGVEEFFKNEGHSRQSKSTTSVLLMDIDYFKKYNDNYGHLKGDEVLKAVSEQLKGLTEKVLSNKNFVLARYGGEEFVIIVRDCSREEAQVIGDEIVSTFARAELVHEYSEVKPYITLSIGISSSDALMPYEEMLSNADEALYGSKGRGRNRWTHYDDLNIN